MLLCTVPNPTSFQNLRTVNGVTYPTFQAACSALGLLANDDEYDLCLSEATTMQTGGQLRRLFSTILLECTPRDPQRLWDNHWNAMTDDCAYLLRQRAVLTEITPAHIESYGLILIDEQLQLGGKRLRDFHLRQPSVAIHLVDSGQEKIIMEELQYDRDTLQHRVAADVPKLNVDQRNVFDKVTDCYLNQEPRLFMLDGPGGTGKTHVENVILAFVRSRGDIALAVASTGISAIILEGGRTSFSRFKIPLDPTSDTVCSISRQTQLAELLRLNKLTVWDEITSQHIYAVLAVERTMRDVRGSTELFGGCPMLFSGM